MALDVMEQPALEARHLLKSYGDVAVLHDINITMAAGEFLVLVGPSHCRIESPPLRLLERTKEESTCAYW